MIHDKENGGWLWEAIVEGIDKEHNMVLRATELTLLEEI